MIFFVRVIAHKFYQSRKLNNISCIAVDLGYKIVKKDHEYDLTKLQLHQLIKNLEAMKKAKNTSCEFGSLLICILFYVKNYFPTTGRILWDINRTIVDHLNELIHRLGDNFEVVMDNYFDEFKRKMKNGLRIPKLVVDKYYDNLFHHG